MAVLDIALNLLLGLALGTLGGLFGIGGGLMCPRLSFGGGGPPIGTFGTGFGTSGNFYVNGSPLAPSGYTLPSR